MTPDRALALSELLEELKAAFADINIIELRIGPVIGCHGGPGLAGFVFSEKYDFNDYEG